MYEKIGFIGGGSMGEAMMGSLLRSNVFNPSDVFVRDIDEKRMDFLKSRYGVKTVASVNELFSASQIIVLAIKPQGFDGVLAEIAGGMDCKISERKMIVSIAAGVSLKKIEGALYSDMDDANRKRLPVMRVMPNTPALVSEGMSGICANSRITEPDMAAGKRILEAMGDVIEFDEKDMDAVTAISGSGPAYLFYIVESMIKAGVDIGLKEEDAILLVTKTFKGALALMEKSGEKPEVLRKKVTSPGGTTEAAVKTLSLGRVEEKIIEAVRAAFMRSKELTSS